MKGEKKTEEISYSVKIGGGRQKHLLSSVIQKLITRHLYIPTAKRYSLLYSKCKLKSPPFSLLLVHCKQFASYYYCHRFSLQEKMNPFWSFGLDEFGGQISAKQGNLEL